MHSLFDTSYRFLVEFLVVGNLQDTYRPGIADPVVVFDTHISFFGVLQKGMFACCLRLMRVEMRSIGLL